MSLTERLPNPVYSSKKNKYILTLDEEDVDEPKHSKIPPYGYRKNWKPKCMEDFGDGGAFPEIDELQYPLRMGETKRGASSNALSLQMDASGDIKYDTLLRQGSSSNKNKIIYSKYSDMATKNDLIDDDELYESELLRPSEDVVEDITQKTKEKLDSIVEEKRSNVLPTKLADKRTDASYYRYTPIQNGVNFNSNCSQRIVRISNVQRDPLSPPRFKLTDKIPAAPPSPPAPVLHSPPRKITAKEQQDWKIPPCISNWKNARGYTIPLDKRIAADGRRLISSKCSEKLFQMTNALDIADKKVREEVEYRMKRQEMLDQKKKDIQEDQLRRLAKNARNQRAQLTSNYDESNRGKITDYGDSSSSSSSSSDDDDNDDDDDIRKKKRNEMDDDDINYEKKKKKKISSDLSSSDNEEVKDKNQLEEDEKRRNLLRKQKQRERKQQLALERNNPKYGKKFDAINKTRDISEQIALGLPHVQKKKEDDFDTRLIAMNEGISTGFGDEDAYNVYDEPWRKETNAANVIYRPTKQSNVDKIVDEIERIENEKKFVSETHFSGADADLTRNGPVQFERSANDLRMKSKNKSSDDEDNVHREKRKIEKKELDDNKKKKVDDPTGMITFLNEVKKSSVQQSKKSDKFNYQESFNENDDFDSEDERRSRRYKKNLHPKEKSHNRHRHRNDSPESHKNRRDRSRRHGDNRRDSTYEHSRSRDYRR
ncbi:hypothetical protein SNEBB_000618 [Seison nebaliae]|nr:hypothetical protein SNEBB_000618 [Seison nebaliae]